MMRFTLCVSGAICKCLFAKFIIRGDEYNCVFALDFSIIRNGNATEARNFLSAGRLLRTSVFSRDK